MFTRAVDYTEVMDQLQFFRDRKDEALRSLPADCNIWTEKDWDLYRHWSDQESEYMANPPCICRGQVAERHASERWVRLTVALSPKPKHPYVPNLVVIPCYLDQHGWQYFDLHKRKVGERIEVKGVFKPPMWPLHDDATGSWFELKRSTTRLLYGGS